MLKSIVPQPNEFDNPYDALSEPERDEYNAYLDDCKAQVRDPEPSDFPCESPKDLIELGYVPFDNELDDPAALAAAGWTRCHICDCGNAHTSTVRLNANTGNWLCPDCIEARDLGAAKREQLDRDRLQCEIEYLSDPLNMFREYLLALGVRS